MYRIGAMVIGLALLVAGCTAGGSGAAAPTITTVTTHDDHSLAVGRARRAGADRTHNRRERQRRAR